MPDENGALQKCKANFKYNYNQKYNNNKKYIYT